MIITHTISKGHLVGYTYGQDAVAASQTDVQLPRVIGEASEAVDNSVAIFPGEVIGLAYTLDVAGSAGTLSVGATIDGTEVTASTKAVGTTTEGYVALKRGTAPFVAGANIGAEITSNGSWNGTTADLVVDVYVLYYLEGI